MAKAKAKPDLGSATRVLLLHGKEAFLLGAYLDQLIDAVRAEGTETDVLRFDGQSASLAEVLDECRSPGLMMQHKVVVVDDAEKFVKGDDRRRVLERYAQDPAEGSTLVLRSQAWHAGKLDKLIPAHGAVIKCDEVKPARAKKWVSDRARARHGVSMDADAVELLVARVGCDLARLATEVDKLSVGTGEGGTVSREDVALLVGASREEKAWVIQEAVLTGDGERALWQLRELLEMPKSEPLLIRFALASLAQRLLAYATAREGGARPANTWPIPPARAGAIHKAVGRAGLAALLREAVEADRRAKSGMGDEVRSLERLTLRFARGVGA